VESLELINTYTSAAQTKNSVGFCSVVILNGDSSRDRTRTKKKRGEEEIYHNIEIKDRDKIVKLQGRMN
jgi:hypothetical protein